MTDGERGYRDLHEHLETLKERGLLLTVAEPIDKDAELNPLVRWQFAGGLDEPERKAEVALFVVVALDRAGTASLGRDFHRSLEWLDTAKRDRPGVRWART